MLLLDVFFQISYVRKVGSNELVKAEVTSEKDKKIEEMKGKGSLFKYFECLLKMKCSYPNHPSWLGLNSDD